MHLPSILMGITCAILIYPEPANGLNCYVCYPCDEKNPGRSEACDSKPYNDLPDHGKVACSYEHGVGESIRKRCRFIREDPDANIFKEEPSCSASLFRANMLDCVCFTNDCNKFRITSSSDIFFSRRSKSLQADGSLMASKCGHDFQRTDLKIIIVWHLFWIVLN